LRRAPPWQNLGHAMEPADAKTMFEIFRETDYNRTFHYVFYTELEEHHRDDMIAKAASGETVFTGYLADKTKEKARAEVESIVEELNGMDEDEAGMSKDEIQRRLSPYLAGE
jgi:hypothetical protein